MKSLFLLIAIELFFIINGDPDVKHFYIESNKAKCALFDLSSDIDVIYTSKFGMNSTKMDFSQTTPNQFGLCDNGTDAQFNISLNSNDVLVFNFINSNQIVKLTSIQFVYKLPNDSLNTDLLTNTLKTNISLSNANNFYQCKSKLKISLSDNVTVNIYYVKLKVFNVKDSSFGDKMDECPEDFSTYTTESTTQTSTISTTSTSTTSASTTHTSITSTSPTSHTSITSTSPTSHTSTTSTTSSHSTETQTTTKSSPSTVTSHLSSTSSKIITSHTYPSTPFSTTTKPDEVFIYKVTNSKNVICLLIQSNIIISINYPGSKTKNQNKQFILSNSSSNGNCLDATNEITINSVPDVNLTLIFSKDSTYSKLHAVVLTYILNNKTFPDYERPNKFMNESTVPDSYQVDVSKLYVCQKNNISLTNSIIEFKSFQYEAFRNTVDPSFGKETANCDLAKSPVVAIVVGIVLAVFLVIVVVVFLIFRYRANKRKGYEEI